jgi:hypothetical protein
MGSATICLLSDVNELLAEARAQLLGALAAAHHAAYDGPGRIAFDSRGNIWVTNNFEPPGIAAGSYVISLDPTGNPRLGDDGALHGGGVLGNWWGIAVDQRDRVWLSNFTGEDPKEYDEPGFVGGTPSRSSTATARRRTRTGSSAKS